MSEERQRLHEQNLRDLRMIREDPAWALSMVQQLREAQATIEQLRKLVNEVPLGEFNSMSPRVRRWLADRRAALSGGDK